MLKLLTSASRLTHITAALRTSQLLFVCPQQAGFATEKKTRKTSKTIKSKKKVVKVEEDIEAQTDHFDAASSAFDPNQELEQESKDYQKKILGKVRKRATKKEFEEELLSTDWKNFAKSSPGGDERAEALAAKLAEEQKLIYSP